MPSRRGNRFSTSSLVTRLTTDVTNVQNAFMMIIRTAVRSPLMLIFAVVMSIRMGGAISLVFLLVIPILAFGLLFIAKRAMPLFKAVFHKEEDETYPFEGETIDLTQVFLDELFLQLPMVSLCKPDCKGLCPVCGIDLNRFRCNCAEKTRNSAFDALKALSFEDKEV